MNVLELFSCSGGMAEGLRRAGLPVTQAFDYDTDACDSYERNFGHRPVQIDARDLLRMARSGWSPGPIALFVADPPCTPWSRAGKRLGTADERDMLDVTVELVRLLQPTSWLIANVPGLDDAPNWPVVQRTIGSLCDRWCVDFRTLDAADYGVPQHRVRPFWDGHPIDWLHIGWPAPTHGAPTRELTFAGCELMPWVTCRQALGHLPAEQLGTPISLRWRGARGANGNQIASVPDAPARVVGTSSLSDGNVLSDPTSAFRDRRESRSGRKQRASHFDALAWVICAKEGRGDGSVLFDGPNHRPSRADAPARALTRNTHGDGALLVNDKHPVNTPDGPSYTVTTKGDGPGAQGACVLATYSGHPISRANEPGHVVSSSQPGNGGAVLEWPWDVPSTVVTTRPGPAEPGHHTASNLSTPNAIKLSETAAAILQGFHEGWHFCGATKRARWAQIGMAMPPPLAEAVGRSVLRSMTAASGPVRIRQGENHEEGRSVRRPS